MKLTANSSYNLIPDNLNLFWKKKMHDLVNNCLFGANFKVESQKGTFSSYFAIPKRKKEHC